MIDAYLARIGYDGPRDPTASTLRALHERHMLAVPFENLDIVWKRPIVVDADGFLRKVIDERRGGFCYELNGAFAALLRALGFDVTMLSGRVVSAGNRIGPPFDHMALLVRIGDERWLADVGFGESFVTPLRLEHGEGEAGYRVVSGGEWEMQSERDGEWLPEYRFDLDAHELHEFAPMCHYHQTSPRSTFTQKTVCSRATESGRITLTVNRLIETHDGVRREVCVGPEDWDRVLWETFGIARPAI